MICVMIETHHGINTNKNTGLKVKHGHETQENIIILLYLFKSLCWELLAFVFMYLLLFCHYNYELYPLFMHKEKQACANMNRLATAVTCLLGV